MDPFLFAALVFLSQATAPPAAMGGCTNEALVGTWRMTKGTFGGNAIPLGPSDPVPMKQVTPTHFVMFTYEPAKKTFLYAHGGPFKATGAAYDESVEYRLRRFVRHGRRLETAFPVPADERHVAYFRSAVGRVRRSTRRGRGRPSPDTPGAATRAGTSSAMTVSARPQVEAASRLRRRCALTA